MVLLINVIKKVIFENLGSGICAPWTGIKLGNNRWRCSNNRRYLGGIKDNGKNYMIPKGSDNPLPNPPRYWKTSDSYNGDLNSLRFRFPVKKQNKNKTKSDKKSTIGYKKKTKAEKNKDKSSSSKHK